MEQFLKNAPFISIIKSLVRTLKIANFWDLIKIRLSIGTNSIIIQHCPVLILYPWLQYFSAKSFQYKRFLHSFSSIKETWELFRPFAKLSLHYFPNNFSTIAMFLLSRSIKNILHESVLGLYNCRLSCHQD